MANKFGIVLNENCSWWTIVGGSLAVSSNQKTGMRPVGRLAVMLHKKINNI